MASRWRVIQEGELHEEMPERSLTGLRPPTKLSSFIGVRHSREGTLGLGAAALQRAIVLAPRTSVKSTVPPGMFMPKGRNGTMLRVQFDVGRAPGATRRPDHPGGRGHAGANGGRVSRQSSQRLPEQCSRHATFPSFASAGAFVDYARFIAQHRARVQRVALVNNSALAPVAKFMANRIVGVEMQHFPFAEAMAALAWLRSP